MPHEVNAHDFPEVYDKLGIHPDKLGCVLLDLAKIPVTQFIPETEADIRRELFTSANPDRWWIDGAVSERKAHVTLLYGLLSREYQDHIRTVLADWPALMFVEVEGLDVFPSPYKDESYSCIVARIRQTPELLEARARLELLPHINTFLEWKTHVTLAYVRTEYTDKWVSALKDNLPPILVVEGLDIGDQHD